VAETAAHRAAASIKKKKRTGCPVRLNFVSDRA
jgi:hypothetical protein